MASETAGYSATPLVRKLGIKAGMAVHVRHCPLDYAALLAPLPEGVSFRQRLTGKEDLVHLFHSERTALDADLQLLRSRLRPDAVLWVSWPKKASKVATDITEDVIRALALPLGFVDVKVCAVDATWSGLKLVLRKSLR